MPHLLHPFSRRLQGEMAYDGEYHFTPCMESRGERHCHEYYELYIHLQGGELFSIGSQLAPMEPNQLVVIPPYCMHGLLYEKPLVNYERMFLYIMPGALREAGGEMLGSLLQRAAEAGQYFFPLSDEEARLCLECIRQMAPADEPRMLQGFDSYVSMLRYLQVVAHAVAASVEPLPQPAAFPLIQQVVNYLDAHFTEPIALADVAAAFHLSVSSLCHEFSRYNRHSIYDYVLYRRIILACELMGQGLSLTETAYRCGFNNYNSFLRAFRKFIGMSPREYLQA